ncbi:MAG: hypothetical protein WDN00_11185 [Limisphaerales bacterium]
MNSFSTIFNRFAGWTGLLLALILLSGGCASTSKPASASFAGVLIANHTAQQIRDAHGDCF